jgi:hypothetical protein
MARGEGSTGQIFILVWLKHILEKFCTFLLQRLHFWLLIHVIWGFPRFVGFEIVASSWQVKEPDTQHYVTSFDNRAKL